MAVKSFVSQLKVVTVNCKVKVSVEVYNVLTAVLLLFVRGLMIIGSKKVQKIKQMLVTAKKEKVTAKKKKSAK